MLLFCYAAVLLNLTYYAQVQELWWEYYAICIQICMNNLLHVADDCKKTILL